MSLSKADREWIRRQLARHREDVRLDLERALQDVLAEEARVAMLNSVKQDRPT